MLRSLASSEMSSLTKLLGKEESLLRLGRGMAASPTCNWAFKLRLTQGLQTTTLSLDAVLHSPNQASLITPLQACPPNPGLTHRTDN